MDLILISIAAVFLQVLKILVLSSGFFKTVPRKNA